MDRATVNAMTNNILTPDEVEGIREAPRHDGCDCVRDFKRMDRSHRAQAARIEELEAAMYGPDYEKQLAAQRLCDTERRIDEDVIL